jgi:hypothetical protein
LLAPEALAIPPASAPEVTPASTPVASGDIFSQLVKPIVANSVTQADVVRRFI